jgi:SAM-dependent MidA family methyltransferase
MWLTWRDATERALYGADGFYRAAEQPACHFRTSVHASASYAAAVSTLLHRVDAAIGRPAQLDLVDVGAGGGELASRMLALVPSDLRMRLNVTAVEVAPPPPGAPREIRWVAEIPATMTGLVIANEWLDNIPVDVVEQTATGPRLVLVDPVTGIERLGAAPDPDDTEWLAQWWPLANIGDRAEVGRPRDDAWRTLIKRIACGVAVAMDYAHTRSHRLPRGTLTGTRLGRPTRPLPDGSCDITSHVAIDAVAAAGAAIAAHHTGRCDTALETQRDALHTLGIRGHRPAVAMAHSDPARYLRDLQTAGEEGELLDPDGLGAFTWLIQTVNYPGPSPLGACSPDSRSAR